MDWEMLRTGADREYSTEVNIPVAQIVEEITEVSKSSIEWRNIQSVSWMSLCETGQLI